MQTCGTLQSTALLLDIPPPMETPSLNSPLVHIREFFTEAAPFIEML